jgi:hypothetical protein
MFHVLLVRVIVEAVYRYEMEQERAVGLLLVLYLMAQAPVDYSLLYSIK